ncbi:MAG: hypothetical protein ACUVQP_08835 [Bacteroidales bacterium]
MKKKGKHLSADSITQIKRLLDGYRLSHGYTLVKRKKKKHKKIYKLFSRKYLRFR